MKKLTEAEITERIKELEYWDYIDEVLHTSLDFKNFADAFAMMCRIAFEAERLDHHPEWTNVYNNLSISLTTHSAGGITEKDFELATIIENIIKGE
ncbi:4a-hydroxytetrahydrobiopterin dehydratase [Abyssalbus ytuae]|uniref:Putative pterin-4-alpha-carbinolamine dehydratase n=1 Tax=Abyssalbus ytuae TaxID=2926907 RepID=A0A9E6ZQN8_9FLAO|nr:4a-hydroxytetrahydrobiopterin dehydratase [Abyssalbus ytuae]UOB17013.1 4a-hydroxytetrahydrobiopterin dehydratase [Abyssalbus ytuae]